MVVSMEVDLLPVLMTLITHLLIHGLGCVIGVGYMQHVHHLLPQPAEHPAVLPVEAIVRLDHPYTTALGIRPLRHRGNLTRTGPVVVRGIALSCLDETLRANDLDRGRVHWDPVRDGASDSSSTYDT